MDGTGETEDWDAWKRMKKRMENDGIGRRRTKKYDIGARWNRKKEDKEA